MKQIFKTKLNLLYVLLSILISVPALLGLLHVGFPITDDGSWMIIRLSAFFESFRDGQFPVRFLLRLNSGYGYPVADFLYPLFLYLGSFIHILGFNFINSIKILFGLSLVLSSVFSYLWLKKIFSNLSSLLGSLIYLYFPYHLYDVYVRGSLGEALSFSIVPFILWQIENKNIFLLSLGIAFLILAHNSLALFFLPIIFIYALLRNIINFRFIITSIILGLMCSSFFIIPAIYDLQFTKFNSTKISDFYTYFLNLESLSLLGVIFIILTFISIAVLFLTNKKLNKFFVFSNIFNLCLLFLLLPVSKPVWDLFPFKGLVQFPFRLISVIVLLAAFELAYFIELLKGKKRIIVSFSFIAIIFISAFPYLNNIKYELNEDSYYSTNLSTTTVKNEYMPKWVNDIPQNYPSDRVLILGGGKINLISNRQNFINFKTVAKNGDQATINIIYFPGWEVYINGKVIPIKTDNSNGLINFNLVQGKNDIVVKFGETQVRIIADILSIIGFIILITLALMPKISKYKHENTK